MSPSCCGSGSSCACKISAGPGIQVAGSGTAVDPFVLSAKVGFTVVDNPQFDLSLIGTGSTDDPYQLTLQYASTSRLDDVPDVNATNPANGQVLSWNAASSTWVPANPTTAAAGSVNHDTSLSGDGSVGTPLGVAPSTSRFIGIFAAPNPGVGINDLGINQMVRHFVDDTARAAASPAPVLNTLSMLDSVPGRINYWDGAQWAPQQPSFDTVTGPEFLALSGPYAGSRTTHLLSQFSGNTDSNGIMDVLLPADLVNRAGVLSVMFQETGTPAFKAVLFANTDRVSAYVYRISDGTPYASFAFTGMIDAWVY